MYGRGADERGGKRVATQKHPPVLSFSAPKRTCETDEHGHRTTKEMLHCLTTSSRRQSHPLTCSLACLAHIPRQLPMPSLPPIVHTDAGEHTHGRRVDRDGASLPAASHRDRRPAPVAPLPAAHGPPPPAARQCRHTRARWTHNWHGRWAACGNGSSICKLPLSRNKCQQLLPSF